MTGDCTYLVIRIVAKCVEENYTNGEPSTALPRRLLPEIGVCFSEEMASELKRCFDAVWPPDGWKCEVVEKCDKDVSYVPGCYLFLRMSRLYVLLYKPPPRP